jgi:hypothetical protein
MLRMNDTRYYHEFDTDFILREYTSREAKAQDLNVSKQIPDFWTQVKKYSDVVMLLPCRWQGGEEI